MRIGHAAQNGIFGGTTSGRGVLPSSLARHHVPVGREKHVLRFPQVLDGLDKLGGTQLVDHQAEPKRKLIVPVVDGVDGRVEFGQVSRMVFVKARPPHNVPQVRFPIDVVDGFVHRAGVRVGVGVPWGNAKKEKNIAVQI